MSQIRSLNFYFRVPIVDHQISLIEVVGDYEFSESSSSGFFVSVERIGLPSVEVKTTLWC